MQKWHHTPRKPTLYERIRQRTETEDVQELRHELRIGRVEVLQRIHQREWEALEAIENKRQHAHTSGTHYNQIELTEEAKRLKKRLGIARYALHREFSGGYVPAFFSTTTMLQVMVLILGVALCYNLLAN